MASDSLRELYHERPEAFERLAQAKDNPFTAKMKRVVEREKTKMDTDHQRVPADD